MTYRIVDDLLQGDTVVHVGTAKKSGAMKPVWLVIHYTATDNYDADVETLSTGPRPASCHLVVAPDGRITQIGTFRDKLWHAGKSAWKGYSGLNASSIGIEVTCPGPIDRDQARYGAKLKPGQPYLFADDAHKNGGPVRRWAIFTDAQIAVVQEVGTLLMAHYGLREAVGHDDIAPTRKIDPGPSCPAPVFAYLNGTREDEEPVERPEIPATGTTLKVTGVAPETLTFRASPNGDKRGALPENQIVEELARQGNWVQVRTPAGHVGWVFGRYVTPA